MILSRPDQDSLNKLIASDKIEIKQTRLNKFIGLFTSNLGFGFNKQQKPTNKNIYIDNKVTSNQVEIVTNGKCLKQEETIDYGYCSIPANENPLISEFSSTSDLCTTSSSKYTDILTIDVEFKQEIDDFLNNIQKAIDIYVRPSIMFKVLSIEEAFMLYQNIEKLIPVTKFLYNIINSFDLNLNELPNAESLKIVFDSFKIYLNGLPKSISLLGDLTYSNDKFFKFIEELGETCSFKIMDFLFMPLRLVQTTIDFLKNVQTKNSQPISSNQIKLNEVVADLYKCAIDTYMVLEDDIENQNSITTVSDCSDFYSLSSDEESTISIKVRSDGKNGH